MWIVVYMTQDKNSASNVGKMLEEKGLLTKLRNMGSNESNNYEKCYEILVPESEVNEAHDIIIENNIL